MRAPPPETRRRLLFVVTEDWYFVSHRLGLARAARNAGYEVAVATRVDSTAAPIRDAGLEVLPLRRLRRSSFNPVRELAAIGELLALYRRWQPGLVHHVALKPVLYGSLAAALARVPARVNALAGLGFVFVQGRLLAHALRPLILAALRWALGAARSRAIVQNPDDAALLVERVGLPRASVRLIRGSGVDLQEFRVEPVPPGEPLVLLMSRMLWDKGVGEFVEAARLLRARGTRARFVLVGDPDGENPAAIPVDRLRQWQASGVIEWWGHRADAAAVIAQATIVALPSYREGLPKVLLEAAACGRPMVATDVPGCREIVVQETTGLLVPPRDAAALADAMLRLLEDAALRERLGAQARALAEREFGSAAVIEQTLAVYRELAA